MQGGHDRQSPDKLGNQAIFDQILGFYPGEHFADAFAALLAFAIGGEANATLLSTAADDLFQSGESTAADEQNIGGIDLEKFLLRMLASALWRHRGNGPFDQFQ